MLMQTYRLPDGTTVQVDATASKDEPTITFQLKGGAFVLATRADDQPRDFEASELGFQPGVWPASFSHMGVEYVQTSNYRIDQTGTLLWVAYRRQDGVCVKVYND